MTKQRHFPTAAAAGIAAILILSVWLVSSEPPPLRVCRLPDGSELRLESVTYGRHHQFVGGRWWRRLLVPLLPASLKGLAGAPLPADRTTDSDSITFWVSRSGPGRSPGTLSRAVVFDEKGHGFDLGVSSEPIWPKGEVRSWTSSVFPRRSRQIGLRFYQRAGPGPSSPVGEFIVPNPAPEQFPVWQAVPLPAIRRDGDLALTLTALETGLREQGPVRPPWSRGEGIWTCATARLTQSGLPSREWQIGWMSLTDATGNRLEPIALASSPAPGETHAIFLGSLWPDETAWKVRVRYSRTARFAPADLWTVTGVPVAARGVRTTSTATATRHGVTLHLVGMIGPQTPVMEGGFPLLPQSDSPQVQVEAVSPPGALQIGKGIQLAMLRASDDQGRLVPGQLVSISGSGQHFFRLKTATNARRVTLTFAVVKERIADFVVKPTWR